MHSLVDLGGLVLLMFSIPSDSFTLSSSLTVGSHDLWGKGIDEDIPFRLSLYAIFVCGSLDLFSKAAKGNVSDDD